MNSRLHDAARQPPREQPHALRHRCVVKPDTLFSSHAQHPTLQRKRPTNRRLWRIFGHWGLNHHSCCTAFPALGSDLPAARMEPPPATTSSRRGYLRLALSSVASVAVALCIGMSNVPQSTTRAASFRNAVSLEVACLQNVIRIRRVFSWGRCVGCRDG